MLIKLQFKFLPSSKYSRWPKAWAVSPLAVDLNNEAISLCPSTSALKNFRDDDSQRTYLSAKKRYLLLAWDSPAKASFKFWWVLVLFNSLYFLVEAEEEMTVGLMLEVLTLVMDLNIFFVRFLRGSISRIGPSTMVFSWCMRNELLGLWLLNSTANTCTISFGSISQMCGAVKMDYTKVSDCQRKNWQDKSFTKHQSSETTCFIEPRIFL